MVSSESILESVCSASRCLQLQQRQQDDAVHRIFPMSPE